MHFNNKPARDLVLDHVLISTKDYYTLGIQEAGLGGLPTCSTNH